jgi:hypothetical protein
MFLIKVDVNFLTFPFNRHCEEQLNALATTKICQRLHKTKESDEAIHPALSNFSAEGTKTTNKNLSIQYSINGFMLMDCRVALFS